MTAEQLALGVGARLEDLPLRPSLRGKTPYGAPMIPNVAQLNVNENPYPPSPELAAALTAAVAATLSTVNRYPDRDLIELRLALAQYLTEQTSNAVAAANVWAANGSNEVLQQVLQAFGGAGRRSLGFVPSYSMHPILADGMDTEFVGIEREPGFSVNVDKAVGAIEEYHPDIVFITTPNNPTGQALSLDEIEELVRAAPGIIVIDEAYAEFSAVPSAIALIERYPAKVIVSRTMSKAFAFAGARVGYLVAAPAIVDAIQLVRLPYHLSAMTQALAITALAHRAETLDQVAHLRGERDRIARGLETLGFTVIDSETNFLLVGDYADPGAAWQHYLDGGVLIRNIGIAGHLRVSVGLDAENDRFLELSADPRLRSEASQPDGRKKKGNQ